MNDIDGPVLIKYNMKDYEPVYEYWEEECDVAVTPSQDKFPSRNG